MKVFRYPVSSPDNGEKTDEVSSIELGKQLSKGNEIDFDITVDKFGSRQSRVSLELSFQDLESLHKKYLEELSKQIKVLEGRLKEKEIINQRLTKQQSAKQTQWLYIKRILDKLDTSTHNLDFVINYIKRIAINEYVDHPVHRLPESGSDDLEWILELKQKIITGKDNGLDIYEI